MTASSFDTVTRIFGDNLTGAQKLDVSKKEFLDSLNPRQRESFEYAETFIVCTPGGIHYAVTSHGTIACQDQDETYYLRIRNVNIWDELAIKKGWLENAPEEILKRAVRLVFETSTPERERDEDRQLRHLLKRQQNVEFLNREAELKLQNLMNEVSQPPIIIKAGDWPF